MSDEIKEQVCHLLHDRPDAELRQLALDIVEGRVFTDWHLRGNEGMITSVFIVLALMDEEQMRNLRSSEPGMIYEYISKACPMACNGCPMFLSFRVLSTPDANQVRKYVRELQAHRQAFATAAP